MSAARERWFVVGLGLGLAALMTGLVVLGKLAFDEREDALAQLERSRRAVESLATRALEDALAVEVASLEREVEAALSDPLRSSRGLLLVRSGERVLPRHARAAGASRARAVLAAHEAGLGGEEARDEAGLGSEEAVARSRLVHALDGGEATLAAWLDHRARFAIPTDVELPLTVAAVARLARTSLPPARAVALLRDGVARPDGRVPGLFPALLAARAKLSEEDFGLLLDEAVALGRAHLVRVDDVLARVAEERAAPVAPFEEADEVGEQARAVVHRGRLWALRRQGDRILGKMFAEPELLAKLAADYVAAGHMDEGAVFSLTAEGGVEVRSGRWLRDVDAADTRLALKLAPLGVVAALAVGVGALAVLLQRRRAAYIALRSQLLAAVTHELKTPLASIRALAETLERRLAGQTAARDYPTRIVASAERLGYLVDNVLSFARLERGAWRPRLLPVGRADLEAMAVAAAGRASRPVELTVALEGWPAEVALMVDPELLGLVVSNLVDNAARYAAREGVCVRVGARREAGLVVTVGDDGPGLGVARPECLFEDLARGRVEGVRGSGLGLSICREVMALHGGQIRVGATSAAGTIFELRFPAGTVVQGQGAHEEDV